jgi:hypothetical protein
MRTLGGNFPGSPRSCWHPLAETAAAKGSGPLRFYRWLELLRVISELVVADNRRTAGRPVRWRLNNGAHPLNAPSGEDTQTRRCKRRPV